MNNEASDKGSFKGLFQENTARKRDLLQIFRRSISLQLLRDWRAVRIIARSGLFDRGWYLKNYPDVAARGIDPVRHYVAYGAREGRDLEELLTFEAEIDKLSLLAFNIYMQCREKIYELRTDEFKRRYSRIVERAFQIWESKGESVPEELEPE